MTENEPLAPAPEPQPRRERRPWRFGPPFWTITGLLSLVVNLVLLALVLSLGTQVFTLKRVVQDQVLGGLYQNFVLMDQAHIKTTIPVSTSVAAKFDLPLKTETTVILTEDTTIANASVARLTTGGMTIVNAPADIVLPAGTRLPIALDLSVPVDQQIPVNLNVQVDIPLRETELHEPFAGLQEVVRPYLLLLEGLPSNWGEVFCPPGGPLCRFINPITP